jgi:transposase
MFFPEGQVRVFLYGEPTDMRKSFDGLYALVKHALGCDPLSGDLYTFCNRRGTLIKVLYFDRTGFCIWAKRLEQGRFVRDWSKHHGGELDVTGLKLLLEGLERREVVAHKRYRRPASAHRAEAGGGNAI